MDDSFVSNLRFHNRIFLLSNKINYIVQTHSYNISWKVNVQTRDDFSIEIENRIGSYFPGEARK